MTTGSGRREVTAARRPELAAIGVDSVPRENAPARCERRGHGTGGKS